MKLYWDQLGKDFDDEAKKNAYAESNIEEVSAVIKHVKKHGRPFVISDELIGEAIDLHNEEEFTPAACSEESIANVITRLNKTPFSITWIECLSGKALGKLKFQTSTHYIIGLAIIEHAPDNYNVLAITKFSIDDEGTNTGAHLLDMAGFLEKHDVALSLFYMSSSIIDIITSRQTIMGKQRIPKLLQAKAKYRSAREIIYVTLKKSEKIFGTKVSRPIDWSHSWEVCGHWRKCKTIGKDRHGKYMMRGFTWVVPHVKGQGDLVLKKRIVR